ncbi:hypothetical protein [Actinopolyspora saharensis]|uniref:Uncharacterized protein n=1 Tax=Actinopolyspora saharensis TaxID=995062 RepID=A0A1H0Z400_9ACTN|nr:hypothetical protein [Actinopolyspora saharensis]SDQ22222.1 hypothetical protein SAMN04489718_0834 [Actinopolyspora saharensis]
MVTGRSWDLRPFVSWINEVFLPEAKAGPGIAEYGQSPRSTRPGLYGTADAACILYTVDRLDELRPAEVWLREIGRYQDCRSGYFVDDTPVLATAHNTGFAVGALQLFCPELHNGVLPKHRLSFAEAMRDTSWCERFFDTLDWRSRCYEAGEIVTGLASTVYNVSGLVERHWFQWLVDYVENGRLDPATGMVGIGKPSTGDLDQIGGTFHFDFLWAALDRTLGHPQERAEALLGLQRSDGLWDEHNPWWLTFDAVYMLGRALPHLDDDLAERTRRAVGRAVDVLVARALDSGQRERDFVDSWMGTHTLTGAVSAFAHVQRHLFGTERVRTERPLRPVLDRRPYI